MQFCSLLYLICICSLIKYKFIFVTSVESFEPARDAEDFCTALPLPNHPPVAQCRPIMDTSVEYQIEVVVGGGRDVSNQCEIHLILLGRNGESQPIQISSFEGGTKRRQKVSINDIGSLTQVKVVFSGSSSLKWKCRKITVYQAFFWWSFDCIGVLDFKNNTAVYSLSGNKLYTVTVRTGSDSLAETHATIQLNIKGEDFRETGPKVLGDSFLAASQVVALRGADVGKVKEVVIANLADDDPWYCISMDIRGDDGNVAHIPVRRWIGMPYESSISIVLGAQHLMDGAAQDIECFTRANDIISGVPEEPQITKVRCPMYCNTNPFGLVRGSSIHPSSSSICQSAILDGVLSPSGGELIVTAVGPLPNYFEQSDSDTDIISRDYEPSPDGMFFSFFLYQSYSIDNIEKNVRIVDVYGKLAATGRLELRRNGAWGTVCSKGETGTFNQAAARQACQEMGFLHGVYLEEGCAAVNGINMCSAKGYRVVAAAVQCTGSEKTVLNCTFEEPPSFCSDHIYDVVIQCTNFPLEREPMPGTIRLVDSSNSPSLTGIGRLEYYLDGWGTVCDDGFTTASAVVACREMGYTSIKSGNLFKQGCKDVFGENLCAAPVEKINVVNLTCDGSEKNVRSCPHDSHSDIYCVHDEDIVIGCEGNGDPSGIGVYRQQELPDVSLRPFPPLINLGCGDRPINTKGLKGGTGATFIVHCPSSCSEDLTEVRGTFIYTDDSSVCRAALHSGVITDTGGDLVVILGYGQKNYIGSLRSHIQSLSYGPYGRSFMVSKLIPSVRSRIVPEAKRNIYSHYSGESTLIPNSQASFLQSTLAEENLVSKQPLFTWCPASDFSGFHYSSRNFVDASKLYGGDVMKVVSDFTISVMFRVTGRQGTWRTLLAHTECNGFTLTVSNLDDIVFEQICNPNAISTGFKPELGKLNHVLVTFLNADKTLSIFINGRLIVYERTNYEFSFKSPLTIGRSSYIDTEFFEGDIKCIRIFDFVMDPTQIKKEEELMQKPSSVCPLGINGYRSASRNRYTVDGRLCLTPCLPIDEADIDISRVNTLEKTSRIVHPSITISCDAKLEDEHFNGATGEIFRVVCPENCCESTAQVYGSELYAGKSSICRAALHKVIRNSGGEILVTLQNGLTFYEDSLGDNHIKSLPETTPQLRSFSVSRAKQIIPFSCTSDASFIMKMPLGTRQLIYCPSGCREATSTKIFGSENRYSPSSSVCRAAIHAGVLTNKGGQVEISVSHDAHFGSSIQNNIVSSPLGYYLRSFTFPHTTSTLCTFYSLAQNKHVSSGVYHAVLSNWKFYPSTDSLPIRFEITNLMPSISSESNTVGLVVRNVHIDTKETPGSFVLKNFACDEYALYATLMFTDFPSIAGLSFDVKNKGKAFFILTAHANNINGNGEWILKKIIDEHRILIGNPIPFAFKPWEPFHVHIQAKGDSFKGWTLNNKGEKQMIAYVKDVQWTSMSDAPGTVGIHVYEAPSTGVFWTNFEVDVSSSETSELQNRVMKSAFNTTQESSAFRLLTHLRKISERKIFQKIF